MDTVVGKQLWYNGERNGGELVVGKQSVLFCIFQVNLLYSYVGDIIHNKIGDYDEFK